MMKKYSTYLLAIAFTAFTFYSCSDDSTPKAKKDGIIASQDDPDLVVDDLQGEITGDITLAASKDWMLTGPLVVSAGGSLTIEAGTTILAEAGGTNVYIAVERDAQIFAVGTAADPITITSAASSPEAGDWGGLLLMGNATITGGITAVTEVVDFIYGNNPATDTDDSGDLAYLILEYTGARINGEKEFNGLTCYGVGSGTSISNIFVKNGDDDAIEFFGGTVNVSNFLAVNATDDMFDYTQGWSGTLTNAYGVRQASYTAVSSDPRGVEGDGNLDGLTPGLSHQSNPTMTNVTIVNKSTAVFSDVLKIRRSSSGTFSNFLVTWGSAPAPGDFVDFSDGAGAANVAASVTITGTGTNLNTDDNNVADGSTVTVNGTQTGVADASTLFSWTGYTDF